MRGGYIVFLLMVSLVCSGCAASHGPTLSERVAQNAETYGQGRAAVAGTEQKAADYAAAACYYERAARNGSAEAAYALAALYRDKLLGEESDDKTRENMFFWMHEAAVGGWAQAQYEVAVFCYEGKGVVANSQQALFWLEKAAENNHVLAQRFLGALYVNGANAGGKVTVKPDPKKGAAWYLRAAYNDDGPSQAVLGSLYMAGTGLEKDSIQAIRWNRMAAAKGQAGAQERLATLYADQKRRSNYEQSIILYRDDFAKGDASAGYSLGRIYYYAPMPYNNVGQAIKLFRATAETSGASALMLGVATEEGKGAAQNFAEAASWYKKAASMGQNEAYAYLGGAYLDGRGVAADDVEALRLFQIGADGGDARSQRHLAVLYSQGKGVLYDYQKALYWSEEAAKGGDVQAMCLTAAMYEGGIGTTRNLEEARRWYQHAVDFVPGQYEFVREESAASWKQNAKNALVRLEKEIALEKAAPVNGQAPEGTSPKAAGSAL